MVDVRSRLKITYSIFASVLALCFFMPVFRDGSNGISPFDILRGSSAVAITNIFIVSVAVLPVILLIFALLRVLRNDVAEGLVFASLSLVEIILVMYYFCAAFFTNVLGAGSYKNGFGFYVYIVYCVLTLAVALSEAVYVSIYVEKTETERIIRKKHKVHTEKDKKKKEITPNEEKKDIKAELPKYPLPKSFAICPHCKGENDVTASFCRSCGCPIPGAGRREVPKDERNNRHDTDNKKEEKKPDNRKEVKNELHKESVKATKTDSGGKLKGTLVKKTDSASGMEYKKEAPSDNGFNMAGDL